MRQKAYQWFAITALLVAAVGSRAAQAGDEIFVGARVAASQQISMEHVDHSAWDAIVRKYVDQNGMVDYRTLKASAADAQALDGYLRVLSSASPRLQASKDGRLAFWINAYNAVTVHGILQEYPTTSIRNHTAKLWGYNIWKDLQLYVGGQPYSLEQIEHEVLRKMDEPRIHFAIVCASIGCPRLLNEAYLPGRVQAQLEVNACDFFSRPTNFRFDQPNQTFYLSSILSWFGEDFGATQADQLRSIASWLPDEASRKAALRGAVTVSFLDYDWGLNDQPRRRVAVR